MVVKDPRASESGSRPFMRKSEGTGEVFRPEAAGRRNSENANTARRNSRSGMRSSMQKITEVPEGGKRKSGLRSFMG